MYTEKILHYKGFRGCAIPTGNNNKYDLKIYHPNGHKDIIYTRSDLLEKNALDVAMAFIDGVIWGG